MKIAYEYVKIPNNDFVLLCSLLDEYLNDIVGGEIQRSQYLQYNLTDNIHDIVIAYEIKEGEKIPVGCGSFKRYIPEEGEGNLKETAEIKRMFIKMCIRDRFHTICEAARGGETDEYPVSISELSGN